MELKVLPYELTVCKVADTAGLDLDKGFFFIGKTDEEVSLVCETKDAPSNTTAREDGWRALRIQGTLEFSLVGILSKLSTILADNGIGIFAVSTFNTDYILVKEENLYRAVCVLDKAGYTFENELWSAYDSDLTRIDGQLLVRNLPIPEGMYHLVCETIVQHADGTYLAMQRDPRKHMGLKWEASAGGSAIRGEEPARAARRELREETGIDTDRMVETGRIRNEANRTIYVEFFARTDASKDSVKLQEGETVAYKWMDENELKTFDGFAVTRPQDTYFSWLGALKF